MNNVPMLKSKWKQESKMVKIILKIKCVFRKGLDFLPLFDEDLSLYYNRSWRFITINSSLVEFLDLFQKIYGVVLFWLINVMKILVSDRNGT